MREKLSAMLDGDVDEATAKALFTRLKHDAAFRSDWEAWCLVGDVIRDGAQPEMDGFSERVMCILEDEPTVLAPRRRERCDLDDEAVEGFASPPRGLRHRLMAVAASIMGVLAVSGVVVTLWSDGPMPTEMAATPAPRQVASAATATHRPLADARREYMFAHQAMSGGPMPAAMHYIRTVSSPAEE